ncbi:polyprenyl synthetase family protein [Alkalilacustris brevis]|uniref:polyprenyl synthetase family protein n=1 Tax=Alkalilacustris brevis TaxID=2026338 RepID=UPI000E0DD9E4|nr:farnesyl diphosphate synthase [Alkalilacustris brevis]
MSFAKALDTWGHPIEARLLEAIATQPASDIRDAMAHAVVGGKRLRGILVIEGAALHGIPAGQAVHAAAAIEAMHACSLVHDDLPAMDDDDMRRGRPTVHVKWDEATAVLTGDALQTLAFEILSCPACAPEPERRMDLVAALAKAAGAAGMVLGQALDLAAERAETPLTLEQITRLQAGKTGALIGWAGTAGARLAGADPAPLAHFSGALGLAFQIADDILDVEGDPAKAGKRLRKDATAGKATFVSLLGLEGARQRAAELVAEAEAALAPYGAQAETLRGIARFVISREN